MDQELHQLHLLAGQKAGQEKTCGKKIKYPTEEAAAKAAGSHNKWKERRNDVEPYPCFFCNQWHVGKIMPLEVLKSIINEN
jgi:hypothetical protein